MIKADSREDQELLMGIKEADSGVIKQLYDSFLPGIIRFVRSNSGSVEDARDIFQEAIMVIYKKCTSGSFELSAPLETFLFVICRNLWRSQLRKAKPLFLNDDQDWEDPDENILKIMEDQLKEHLFYSHFKLLANNCKQILELFFQKAPMKMIADIMGTSESYVKKRKHVCKEKLIRAIKSDPRYEEIML
jgi:RNA polymerase sigma factor (sigma-70 family)